MGKHASNKNIIHMHFGGLWQLLNRTLIDLSGPARIGLHQDKRVNVCQSQSSTISNPSVAPPFGECIVPLKGLVTPFMRRPTIRNTKRHDQHHLATTATTSWHRRLVAGVKKPTAKETSAPKCQRSVILQMTDVTKPSCRTPVQRHTHPQPKPQRGPTYPARTRKIVMQKLTPKAR